MIIKVSFSDQLRTNFKLNQATAIAERRSSLSEWI